MTSGPSSPYDTQGGVFPFVVTEKKGNILHPSVQLSPFFTHTWIAIKLILSLSLSFLLGLERTFVLWAMGVEWHI